MEEFPVFPFRSPDRERQAQRFDAVTLLSVRPRTNIKIQSSRRTALYRR